MSVEVVPFSPTHASGVSALAKAEGWPTFSDEERVHRLFTAPGVVGLAAVLDGAVAGAAQVLTDGHHGYLTFLVVDANQRGSGIGRRIMAAAFETTGAVRIDLLSTPEAEPFYGSLRHFQLPGYRVYADEPG